VGGGALGPSSEFSPWSPECPKAEGCRVGEGHPTCHLCQGAGAWLGGVPATCKCLLQSFSGTKAISTWTVGTPSLSNCWGRRLACVPAGLGPTASLGFLPWPLPSSHLLRVKLCMAQHPFQTQVPLRPHGGMAACDAQSVGAELSV
jgi:hypothetical protein